jgi:hypothetical protein
LITTYLSHASPTPLTDSFEDGCFSIDILVQQTTPPNDDNGINCAFVELELGDPFCSLTVVGVEVNSDLFPEFNNSFWEPPSSVWDLGGCTNEAGVGAGEWVRLATIDVLAPQDECSAGVLIAQSTMTASSLIGLGAAVAAFDSGSGSGNVEVHCWGDLYDHNGDGFVNPADLSAFATAWPPAAYDAAYDYDLSGVIDAGDVSFFASAMEKYVCAGGIMLPIEQTNCNGSIASVGGPNALVRDENGNVTTVTLPPATAEQIRSFGLRVPVELKGKSRSTGALR